MRCTKCGTESTTSRKFCAACGSPLSSRCPKCGAENAPSSAFCEDCGTALAGHAASAATSSPQAASTAPNIRVTPEQPDASTTLDGERKTVTALFADIKGSTELMADLDPEEARAIVDPALQADDGGGASLRRLRRAIDRRRHLRAVRRAGGARGPSAARAAMRRCGCRRSCVATPTRLRAEGKIADRSRVGVNTGEVVVRSIETGERIPSTRRSVMRPTWRRGCRRWRRRVRSRSSEATQRLCEGYFEFRALGPTAVKGVNEPVNVYEVIGLGPLRTRLAARGAARADASSSGASARWRRCSRALEQAKAGHGQIVAAMAEAGAGKSRLFYEFKATSQTGCMVLEAFSVSHGKASAWLPVIELLQQLFRDRRTTTTRASGARRSTARCWRSTGRWRTRCRTCSRCSVSSKATIRWRRWTRRSGGGARWRRSSGSCCARASSSR